MEGDRKLVADASAAHEALRTTVQHLTSDRVRRIEQRVVAGDPAQALLDVAGNNPANLIVVGNRGLGARDGDNLGSVPAEVVRNATCDVLIVQGTQESPMSVTVPARARPVQATSAIPRGVAASDLTLLTDAWRTTTTGQSAWATRCWLTEPSSMPCKPAVTAGSDHDQVGLLGPLDQHLGGVAFLDRGPHVHRRCPGVELGDEPARAGPGRYCFGWLTYPSGGADP